MKNTLKHVTISITEDHLREVEDVNSIYHMRSRSAALAYIIEEYKRMKAVESKKWPQLYSNENSGVGNVQPNVNDSVFL